MKNEKAVSKKGRAALKFCPHSPYGSAFFAIKVLTFFACRSMK